MTPPAEVVVEPTPHGTWCWRYREPPGRPGGAPVQLPSHTDYDSLDAAVHAARQAYPDAAVRVPPDAAPPSLPARRGRRRVVVLLVAAAAVTVAVVRRSRHRPTARRGTRRS